jgi:hypothetical protein
MCQPSPLGRCSTDASSAYETAELKALDASRKERESRFQLQEAKRKLDAVQAANPTKPAFGSCEDRELKAAKKTFEKAISSWDADKAKKAKTADDVNIKRMHLDTTPAGNKELRENTSAEDRYSRMIVAESVTAWQAEVKELKDGNGNPITSKEGKQSPEAREVYSKLYKEARRNFESQKKISEAAYEKSEQEKKKSRDYETSYGHLVEQQDIVAYRASVTARHQELHTLMYQDRMDDLSKIIQKLPANKV